MQEDKQLENLIRKAKKLVFMTKEEKRKMLSLLMSFMKKNTVKQEQLMRHKRIIGNFVSFFTGNKLMIRYASLASVVLLVIAISGVSLAANNSLPGDFLYPFKVGINEKVLGFILFSDEAKAKYNIQLAELRMQEFEKTAISGRLDDEAKEKLSALFDNHIEKAKKGSLSVKTKNGVSLSSEIDSELEASLNAHKKILDKLSEIKKSDTSERIKSFLPDVEIKINSLKKLRQENESDLAQKPLADIRFAAEGKLKAAENKINEVNNFIEDKRSDLNQESYSIAKANLKVASDIIFQGKTEFDAENFSKAFSLFQEAIRLSQEAKISIAASIKLNIELPKLKEQNGSEEKENNGTLNIQNNDNEKITKGRLR